MICLVEQMLELHKRLDEAVFAAYGWRSDLSDEGILEKLLAFGSLRFASPPSHPSGTAALRSTQRMLRDQSDLP